MEAVVTDSSVMIDKTPRQLRLHERYQVNLLALSRRGERVTPSSLIRRAIEQNILGPGAEGGERPNADAH